jgi:hypothetical protein
MQVHTNAASAFTYILAIPVVLSFVWIRGDALSLTVLVRTIALELHTYVYNIVTCCKEGEGGSTVPR